MKNTKANNSVNSTNEQNNSSLNTAQNNGGAVSTEGLVTQDMFNNEQGAKLSKILQKRREISVVEEEIMILKKDISDLRLKLKHNNASTRYQNSARSKLSTIEKDTIKAQIDFLGNKILTLQDDLLTLQDEFKMMNNKNKLQLKEDKISLRTQNIHWCIRNKWQIKTRVLSLLENLKLEKSEEIFELKSNLTSVDSFNKSLRDLLNKHKPTLSKYCTNELYPLIFPEIHDIIKQWDGNFDSPLVENEKKNILPLEKAV